MIAAGLTLGGCGASDERDVERDVRANIEAYFAAQRGTGPLPTDAADLYRNAFAAGQVEEQREELVTQLRMTTRLRHTRVRRG